MRPILLPLAVLSLAACATTPPGPGAPQSARSVDAERFYTGTWHEIGRRPMRLTDGCVAGTTSYSPGDRPGEFKVVDDCRKDAPDGKVKAISGKGVITDPGVNAKLHVRYLPFVARDYWVLDHADDYSWFISADPTLRDLYIFTREIPSDAQRAALVNRAQQLGYDVSKLEFPAQPAR